MLHRLPKTVSSCSSLLSALDKALTKRRRDHISLRYVGMFGKPALNGRRTLVSGFSAGFSLTHAYYFIRIGFKQNTA